jgi:hypothetical protein
MTKGKMTQRPMSALMMALLATVLLLETLPQGDAYRYTIQVTASTTYVLPLGSANISVSLWGGGGGAASTIYCGAGGGSGAAIINRPVDIASWPVPMDDVLWLVNVGAGGAGSTGGQQSGYGGNGGDTTITAMTLTHGQVFEATAYGGGGAQSVLQSSEAVCQGGAGGGASSSAAGVVPGSGVPAGGSDNNATGPPREGALVGDVKAGGAGSGRGYVGGFINNPYVVGAAWTLPGRNWQGGLGSREGIDLQTYCYTWGGAAGFNGAGGNGRSIGRQYASPAPNSGAGGGSAYVCNLDKPYSVDSAGASGGATIEYDHPIGPSPSPTRTPSVTPSPSSQPPTQWVNLVSPISGKQLTAQDDGSVASLWTNPTNKERWLATRLANGKYTFKSFTHQYLSAHSGGWCRADTTSVGTQEQWEIIMNPGNQWTFKSVHGTYMGTTAAGVVYLNSNADLYWVKSVA